MRRHLVILAKAPRRGRVKRRLARGIGEGAALRFYDATMRAVVRRLAADPRWETWLAVTPEPARWPSGVRRMQQGRGDLGCRMHRALSAFPPGPVVLVGTDIPGIRNRHVDQAFRALGAHDAVFGPAADGGYWLVGLRGRPRRLDPFRNVRWSSAHALTDTLVSLADSCVGDCRVAFVARLNDVDDAVSYARWRQTDRR